MKQADLNFKTHRQLKSDFYDKTLEAVEKFISCEDKTASNKTIKSKAKKIMHQAMQKTK